MHQSARTDAQRGLDLLRNAPANVQRALRPFPLLAHHVCPVGRAFTGRACLDTSGSPQPSSSFRRLDRLVCAVIAYACCKKRGEDFAQSVFDLFVAGAAPAVFQRRAGAVGQERV